MNVDLAALLAQPIAHRGLHACGGPGPVENTIAAALAAASAGFAIECDVQLSRDGEAIVFHDEDLGRLTGASGRLGERDAAALRRLSLREGGGHVPTLPEFLAAIGGRVPLVIEIKSTPDGDLRLVERTIAVVDGYRGAVAIESFDPGIVQAARARTRRPIGLVGPADQGRDPDAAVIAACDFVSWSIDDLAEIATRYPALPRSTWTIRSPEQADRARNHAAQIVFEGFTPLPVVNDKMRKA